METIKPCSLMQHHEDTLQVVRKIYDLDNPRKIDESINILEEWLKKQVHFNKKEFSKVFLENMLMKAKGSVEKTKQRLDAMCTFRTIFPHLYNRNVKVDEITGLDTVQETVLPKLTKEHHRVYVFRTSEKNFSDTFIINYLNRILTLLDYLLQFDYSAGLIIIVDYMESDLTRLLTILANTNSRQALLIVFKAYAMRVKGVHILSKSKLAEALVTTIKHLIDKDIVERFSIHKSLESLHAEIDKDVLPSDYGGNEEPLAVMCNKFIKTISTDEAIEILKEIGEGTVDVNIKAVQKEYDEYLGVSGSFRSLSVD